MISKGRTLRGRARVRLEKKHSVLPQEVRRWHISCCTLASKMPRAWVFWPPFQGQWCEERPWFQRRRFLTCSFSGSASHALGLLGATCTDLGFGFGAPGRATQKAMCFFLFGRPS
ncbi:uncharacterized protein BJX67DRAFT_335106 [Aspergillus lucknowensis]|uniref:Uncharacterized protein n=1 Tax=Aspergillus lucknowensis TaxID=176173 RepID=A0ABR4L5Y8_9EURO